MIQIKENGKVTERQFAGIIVNSVIGVGILTLPRVAVNFAGTGGIMAVILATLLFLINLLLLIKLGLKFPNLTIFEYLDVILGKIFGKVVSIFIMSYWFLASAMVIRAFSELIVTAILPSTPLEIIMIIMLLLVVYLSRKDMQVIARINEIYAFITVFPLLLLVLLSFKRGNTINLLPVFQGHSLSNILKSTINSYFSFSGFEVIAIFLPFITTKKLALRYGVKGWITPALLSIIIVISSISVFGIFNLKTLIWPTFELVKSTQFFALIFERLEVAFIAIWMIAIFTTVTNLLYGVVKGAATVLKLDSHKTLVFPLLPILYLIALVPRNAYELFNIMDLISIGGILVTSILPITLLILTKVRQLGGEG